MQVLTNKYIHKQGTRRFGRSDCQVWRQALFSKDQSLELQQTDLLASQRISCVIQLRALEAKIWEGASKALPLNFQVHSVLDVRRLMVRLAVLKLCSPGTCH